METIYTFEYLRSLFNEMAASYDRVNYLTSFGFSRRFRRQFIEKAGLEEGYTVVDLMCGRGECWPFILSGIGNGGKLLALDMSPGMLEGARRRRTKHAHGDITVIEGNALATGFEDGSVDRVLVAFGLKTLAEEYRHGLAHELYRVLRPGGLVSAIEMSEPQGWHLRPVFMWYLKECGADSRPASARESGELPNAWGLHRTVSGMRACSGSNASGGLRRRSGVVFSRMCDRSSRTKAGLSRS